VESTMILFVAFSFTLCNVNRLQCLIQDAVFLVHFDYNSRVPFIEQESERMKPNVKAAF
jgi:hypothetical protein